jgi:hypothetical protein
MRETFLAGGAVLVLVISGLVHGSWTNRWEQSQALEEAVRSLQRMPARLGDWQGEDLDLEARQFAHSGIDGYKAMGYVDPFDHSRISTLLVVGRAGPVSVHTPDVCYGGAGYEMLGRPARHSVGGLPGQGPSELWVVRFRKQGLSETSSLRVFWAWSEDGRQWQVPDNPRMAFGRTAALYKLYVVREMASADEPLEDDPAVELIRRFITQFAPGAPTKP